MIFFSPDAWSATSCPVLFFFSIANKSLRETSIFFSTVVFFFCLHGNFHSSTSYLLWRSIMLSEEQPGCHKEVANQETRLGCRRPPRFAPWLSWFVLPRDLAHGFTLCWPPVMADVDVSFFFLKIDVDESIQQLETPRHVAGPLAELERKLKAWCPGMCPEVDQGLGFGHIRPDRRWKSATIDADRHCSNWSGSPRRRSIMRRRASGTDTTSLSFPNF